MSLLYQTNKFTYPAYSDEYCPHCDNHFVLEAVTPKPALQVEGDDARVDNRCVLSFLGLIHMSIYICVCKKNANYVECSRMIVCAATPNAPFSLSKIPRSACAR